MGEQMATMKMEAHVPGQGAVYICYFVPISLAAKTK
jgi:hypothetical protein